MMSKIANANSKPKAHFKIVYSPGPVNTPTGFKGAAKIARPQGARTNDLDAAIKSITYSTTSDNQTAEGSTTKDARKMNFTTTQGDGKVEKIVFFPKYVQKKQFKETPKKIMSPATSHTNSIPKQKSFSKLLSPVKKPNEGSEVFAKKRKLGDVSLETWNLKNDSVENAGPSVLCRICGSFVEDEVIDLVDLSGTLTKMGSKLKSIVGTDITDSPLYPPACCKQCSVKLSMCFTLLMEVQASDEVIRCTYADLKEGDLINPSNHIYTCLNCEHEVVGMKEYIHHFERHMQEKVVGKNETNEENSGDDDENDDTTIAAQVFLEDTVADGSIYFQNDLGEYVCETCGRTFKYIFLLQLHRKAPKREPVQKTAQPCFVCKQQSASTVTSDEPCENCQENMESLKTVERDAKDGKVECDVCEKKMLPISLASHRLKHYQRFVCQVCQRSFATKTVLLSHLKTHDNDDESKCHVCLQSLSNVRALRKHLQEEHDIHFNPCKGSFQCEHCAKTFDDLFKLKVHLKLYHNVDLPLAFKAPRIKHFDCHVCKLVLHSENSARIHMKNVHNLTNNQMESLKQACEECGKIFSVKQNLINHINSAHLKVKPMTCEECGERFGKHSSLIFHRLRHTGEKPFKCSLCSKCYRQRNDVMRHLARHVRDRELEYDKAFAINTSSSKYIFKRYVYLKDSTIKGLLELAMCSTPSRRKKPVIKEEKLNDEGEVYEEFVIPEDAVVVNENGEMVTDMQYVVADDDQYVVATEEEVNEEEEDVKYILKNAQGEDEQYVLTKNENGQQVLVPVNEEEYEYAD